MKSANQTRIEMAALGWFSHDRYSSLGWASFKTYGYSAWIERWDWHGVRLGSSVCFHCFVPPNEVSSESIDAAWESVASIAREAWDKFSDCIPRQESGRPTRDETLTRIIESVHNGNPWHANITAATAAGG